MTSDRTEAVVLALRDYGESDKIVTFYCPAIGKLTGIAKGAKRSRKRFVNKLELFSRLEIIFTPPTRSGLARIVEAELLDPFITLREHYDRYVAAALISELMVLWTRENDADYELYPLLLWSLAGLDQGRPLLPTVILFQIKLFGIMGYQPQLNGCVVCGRLDAGGSPHAFSPGRNGLLCVRCRPGAQAGALLPISLSTAMLLKNAQDLPREKLGRLRFSPVSLQEAGALLHGYGQHLLQREIHSWSFLKNAVGA